jgi:hypothetical protein
MSRKGSLKSPAVHSLVVIILLQAGITFSGELSGCTRTLEISSDSVYVTSYPLFISLTTCNVDYKFGVAAYAADLATPFGLKSPVQFQLSNKDQPDDFIVFGKAGGDLHDPTPRAPQEFLQENSCVSTTFDLFQNTPIRGSDLAITPGQWVLRACKAGFLHTREETFCSNEIEISVRAPTEAETLVADVFQKNRSWRSWFPKAVVSGEAFLGDTSALPPETRRVVGLIRMLRDSLDSCDQCMFAMREAEANGVDWGPISSLIAGIQYECASDSGDEKGMVAANAKLAHGSRGDLATHRIENGDGLISNLRRYKAQRSTNSE